MQIFDVAKEWLEVNDVDLLSLKPVLSAKNLLFLVAVDLMRGELHHIFFRLLKEIFLDLVCLFTNKMVRELALKSYGFCKKVALTKLLIMMFLFLL